MVELGLRGSILSVVYFVYWSSLYRVELRTDGMDNNNDFTKRGNTKTFHLHLVSSFLDIS
jgi:hypothetical protein